MIINPLNIVWLDTYIMWIIIQQKLESLINHQNHHPLKSKVPGSTIKDKKIENDELKCKNLNKINHGKFWKNQRVSYKKQVFLKEYVLQIF